MHLHFNWLRAASVASYPLYISSRAINMYNTGARTRADAACARPSHADNTRASGRQPVNLVHNGGVHRVAGHGQLFSSLGSHETRDISKLPAIPGTLSDKCTAKVNQCAGSPMLPRIALFVMIYWARSSVRIIGTDAGLASLADGRMDGFRSW